VTTPRRRVLRVVLWAAAAMLALAVAWFAYWSIRYSPTYMYRDAFLDLGTVYDYEYFPERALVAAESPFVFREDASREALVRRAFEAQERIDDLDAFLADTGTQAFLVIQDDAIIYERYFMGYARDAIVTSFSVAKSFDSLLVGIAIDEGLIGSANDPITKYIPELAERDARFADIEIRHLLMMSSGLRYDPDRFGPSGDGSLTYQYDDLRELALTETEVVEPPGQTFLYNNYNPLLLGLILERATGTSVTAYLQEKVWTLLGMEFAGSWSLDSEKSGFEKMESGINARAVDFAKLGRLYLNGGRWEGRQIVPAAWVAESTGDQGILQGEPVGYGYMWWNRPGTGSPRDFLALGNFGQFVYVSPAKKLIIVRNGERYGLEGEQEAWVEVFSAFAAALE